MADENTSPAPPPDLQTVIGGVELTVTHLPIEHFDESALKRLEKFRPLLGTSEVVKIRQVPVSQMPRYGNAILANDEAAAIEIYCNKDPAWADTLEVASANAIADKGLEINLDFFSAWYRRQAKWRKVQTPESIENLQRKLTDLEKTFSELASRTSVSGSAPSTA